MNRDCEEQAVPSLQVGGAPRLGEEFDDECAEVAARVEPDHPEAISLCIPEVGRQPDMELKDAWHGSLLLPYYLHNIVNHL